MRTRTQELTLIDVWGLVLERKKLVVAIVAMFAMAGIGYAFFATPWYRAEVVMSVAKRPGASGFGTQLGGLASLAGLDLGGRADSEPLAVLRSKELAREFIENSQLMPVIYAQEWNNELGTWIAKDPSEWPDIRDAVALFDEEVRFVSEDPKTGLVVLAIEWTDAKVAAEMANSFVSKANERIRERAIIDTTRNIAFLESEMTDTSVIGIQLSISRLLEAEMQRLMLARGEAEFAFRVIDPAVPPLRPIRPRKLVISLLGPLLGLGCAIIALLFMHAARQKAL